VLQRQLDGSLGVPDTQMTVAQLLERWHNDVLRHQVAPSAADNCRGVAIHHLVLAIGRKRAVQLTPAEVDRLISAKLDSGLAVSTVRRIRSVLVQALDQGLGWFLGLFPLVLLGQASRSDLPPGKLHTWLRSSRLDR